VSQEGFPRELLNRPVSERLAYFRSYTVAHPLLKEADAALKRAIQEPAGGSLVFVIGPTGVGKTTLRLRVEQHLKEAFLPEAKEDVGRIPVIGVEAVAPDSGNFNWKDYYQRALRSLEEPLIRHKICTYGQEPPAFASRAAGAELRYALEQALRFRRTAAVMIDEAQHLTKMASGRKLSDQLDSLKSLANLTGCVHVLIGTYELLPCRNLSAQLSRRSIDIHFPTVPGQRTERCRGVSEGNLQFSAANAIGGRTSVVAGLGILLCPIDWMRWRAQGLVHKRVGSGIGNRRPHTDSRTSGEVLLVDGTMREDGSRGPRRRIRSDGEKGGSPTLADAAGIGAQARIGRWRHHRQERRKDRSGPRPTSGEEPRRRTESGPRCNREYVSECRIKHP
jgi:energy-coupling factor transporter ATP-binding protein EcfA2